MEIPLINPTMLSECSIRLISKVLNAIDAVTFTTSKFFKVVDSEIFKFTHIPHIIITVAISINKLIKLDNKHQISLLSFYYNNGINLSLSRIPDAAILPAALKPLLPLPELPK